MSTTIIVLAEQHINELGRVRTIAGWQAAPYQQEIWLKGPTPIGESNMLIKSLPVLKSFTLDEQDRLFPTGKPTPTGKLPSLKWKPLASFVPITMPISAMPGTLNVQSSIQLTRSQHAKPAYALRITLHAWQLYVNTAPTIRLQQLKFAVSAADEVLVIGKPLPSIPGNNFWENGNLLLPAGYDFQPTFLGALLNQQFSDEKDAFILFESDGSRTVIPLTFFKPAVRSTVRLINP